MSNLTGSRSAFDLTQRDSFSKPSQTGTGGPGSRSSLDAELINEAGDALIQIENWTEGSFRFNTGLTPAFSPTIQRWSVPVVSTGVLAFPVSLALSPAFLEDSGAIPRQSISPSQPQVSLAASISSSAPHYTLTPGGSPPWTHGLADSSISVRRIGGTGKETFGTTFPVFTDSGDGVSPLVTLSFFYSHPDLGTTPIPTGTYEICLLTQAWVD